MKSTFLYVFIRFPTVSDIYYFHTSRRPVEERRILVHEQRMSYLTGRLKNVISRRADEERRISPYTGHVLTVKALRYDVVERGAEQCGQYWLFIAKLAISSLYWRHKFTVWRWRFSWRYLVLLGYLWLFSLMVELVEFECSAYSKAPGT